MTPEADSAAWDRRYQTSELVWTAEPNRFLVAETAALPPGRALDLACGEGRNAVWLAERGWDVTGVDFSAVGIQKARALAERRGVQGHWVVGDLRSDELRGEAFDLVIIFYLHVPAAERLQIMRRAARAVAVGGIFLLVGHDRSNLEEGCGGPQNPEVLYGAADITEDIAGSGLEIERAERVQRPVSTDEGERTAWDVLVRAHRPPLHDDGEMNVAAQRSARTRAGERRAARHAG
ncbi:MAG TPA: class I SAM-dependent methyltransferase [Solirubrobacteraceae bacterium]|nr:class I SAM-dependent methyltransferase [Solirubrobacteraceae bacterium]